MTAEPSIYQQTEQLYNQLGAQSGDRDVALPPIALSHYPITDTQLAACLGTLGIPFREPAPYTDDVDESSGFRRTCFWLGAHAPAENPEDQHRTEELCGAWENRARFEVEHPLHPLVAMRSVLDAREWWINVMHGSIQLPVHTAERDPFLTNSLRDAALLKACGFRALAFTGRAFLIDKMRGCANAQSVIAIAAHPEGQGPAQWMLRVLLNFEHLAKIAKSQPPVVRLTDGDQTLMLRADATLKTRHKFHALLS